MALLEREKHTWPRRSRRRLLEAADAWRRSSSIPRMRMRISWRDIARDSKNDQAGFALVQGPLRRIAEAARQTERHVRAAH